MATPDPRGAGPPTARAAPGANGNRPQPSGKALDSTIADGTNSALDGALAAARRGWHVFPVGGWRNPKAPRPGWRWAERNTTDPATIRAWMGSSTAYGIACGPSRLVVADLDLHDDAVGLVGVEDLCESAHVPWPVTYTVITPSGGLHLYFRADPERKITVSVGSNGGLAPGVDVRGAGGYVVGAGSVIGGRRYRVAGSVLMLAGLPPWLAEPPAPARRPPPAAAPAVEVPGKYVAAALEAEAALVASARQPGRNNQLNVSAWTLARFPAGELPDTVIHAVLGDAARQAGLDGDEITATIRSALRRRTGGAR